MSISARLISLLVVTFWVGCSARVQEANLQSAQLSEEGEVGEAPWVPELNMRGGNYHPMDTNIPFDLANWDELSFSPGCIRRVKLVGFESYNSGQRVDLDTSEAAVLRAIERCNGHAVVRPGVSDIGESVQVALSGVHIGVLKLEMVDRSLIIGVSETGFF